MTLTIRARRTLGILLLSSLSIGACRDPQAPDRPSEPPKPQTERGLAPKSLRQEHTALRPQPERVGDHRYRGQAHGDGRNHGRE